MQTENAIRIMHLIGLSTPWAWTVYASYIMKWTVFVVLFFILSMLCAANLTGKVFSVLDGDTLEILHNQHPERIRLSGIDRPDR